MNLRRTIMITILAVVAGGLLAPNAAISQAYEAKLIISPTGSNGMYSVVVSGRGPANAEVGVRVHGEDMFLDDWLFAFGAPSPNNVSDRDGFFRASMTVYGSALDEDWGRDEVYAVVGLSGVSIRTNTVKGWF